MNKLKLAFSVLIPTLFICGVTLYGDFFLPSVSMNSIDDDNSIKVSADSIPKSVNDSIQSFYKFDTINGAIFPIHLTGEFSWYSNDPGQPVSSVVEEYPGILVYRYLRKEKDPSSISKGTENFLYRESFDHIEFVGKDNRISEVLLLDSLVSTILDSGIPSYEYSNAEITYKAKDDTQQHRASSYWFEKNIYVLKNGFVNVVVDVEFISDQCSCPFKKEVTYFLYDSKGKQVFSDKYVDKSLYEFSTDESGAYGAISWDQTNDYSENGEKLRGVYVFSTDTGEIIYSDSLSTGEGYLTRAKLQNHSSSFNYKIRGVKNKGDDFYSTYLIVDPERRMLFYRDFTRIEWTALQNFNWSLPYPDALVDEFNFKKSKLR